MTEFFPSEWITFVVPSLVAVLRVTIGGTVGLVEIVHAHQTKPSYYVGVVSNPGDVSEVSDSAWRKNFAKTEVINE